MPLFTQKIQIDGLIDTWKTQYGYYKAVEKQFNSTLNAQDRNKLKLQQEDIIQAMTQIEQELNSLGVSLEEIERNQKQEKIILDILEQIDIQILQSIYLVCRPAGWLNPIPQNRAGIWNDLKDMPSVPGEYSKVALFTVKLLEQVDGGIGQKLENFAKENVKDFLDCLNSLTNQSTVSLQSQQQTCIFVWIRHSPKPKKYFVSAYFVTNIQDYDPINDDPKQVCKPLELEVINQEGFTLNKIEGLMETFCQQTGKYNSNNSETPWIEFFLEPDLLYEPIDCWKLYKKDKNRLTITLGCQYAIFTRSSKRLLNNAERPRWLKKWQTLQQQNLNNSKVIFSSALSNLNELFIALKNDESCILVIDKPYQKQQYIKIFSALEDTGIPIVLWIRENSALTDHQIEIRNLVTGTILEFSQKICEKRSEAFEIAETDLEKKHIGNHLTLIWENPNLYPIDIKYSAP